jgi:hypothetical protein
MFFYYALLVALWFFVIGLLNSGGLGLAALRLGDFKLPDALISTLPLIGLLFIAVAARFAIIRSLDAAARKICVQFAAIPAEAEQLGLELAATEFTVAKDNLKKEISRDLEKGAVQRAINFSNDGTVSAAFTRSIALYWLFIMPYRSGEALSFPANTKTRSTYTRIMRLNASIVDQCATQYVGLIETGLAYFTSHRPTRQMDDLLMRNVRDLSQLICGLVARFVLCNDITEGA